MSRGVEAGDRTADWPITRHLTRTGSSITLAIPHEWLRRRGLSAGDAVEVVLGEHLVVRMPERGQ